MSGDPTWTGNSYQSNPSPCGPSQCCRWVNPTCDTIGASGDCKGLYLPTLTTAGILAVTAKLTTRDRGRIVDLIGFGPVRWSGVAWTDLEGQRIIPEAYGALGDGVTSDTAAIVLSLAAITASGVTTILFSQNKNYLLNSRSGPSSADVLVVPAGARFQIDGTISGYTGQTISFDARAGDFQAFGKGSVIVGQGYDNRFFQIATGTVRFSGLRFAGLSSTSTPAAIVLVDPGSGTLDELIIENCIVDPYCQYLYLRQQQSVSTHQVRRTKISDCLIRGIFNGSGILINATAGLDRDIEISDILIDGVSGDSNGQAFSGFGIAVAGSGTLPFPSSGATARVTISDVVCNAVRTGVHVEYCTKPFLNNITVTDVNATYYPTGSESGGVIVYGSFDPVIKNAIVSDVTGDGVYAWGIRVSGGYGGLVYSQSNRNTEVSGCRLRNASYIVEQQVLSSVFSGQPAYELTTSSVLNFTENTTDNGVAQINSVGTVNVRNNTLVGPLARPALNIISYSRTANVATIAIFLVNADIGILLGDSIKVTGLGSGFDVQIATVTNRLFVGSTAFISYANAGVDVVTTLASGSVYDLPPALLLNCSDTYTANSAFNSYYRLALTVENNRASNSYGASSFSLRNVSTGPRYSGNVQLHATGNNFAVATSYLPAKTVNRTFYTTAAVTPTGVEFVVGDCFVNTVGGAANRLFCSGAGYVAPAAAAYAIVSAAAGTIKRTAGPSWLATLPAFVTGEVVLLTNGGNTLIAMVQKVELSGADEVLTLVDPALGTALDLTSVGGPGTLAPYSVATFAAF